MLGSAGSEPCAPSVPRVGASTWHVNFVPDCLGCLVAEFFGGNDWICWLGWDLSERPKQRTELTPSKIFQCLRVASHRLSPEKPHLIGTAVDSARGWGTSLLFDCRATT